MWAAQCVNLTQLLMSDCHMKGRLHSFCGIMAKKGAALFICLT